jgi:hypothetical protein
MRRSFRQQAAKYSGVAIASALEGADFGGQGEEEVVVVSMEAPGKRRVRAWVFP